YDLGVVNLKPVQPQAPRLRRPLVNGWSHLVSKLVMECAAPPPPALVRTMRRVIDLCTYCARGGPAATVGCRRCWFRKQTSRGGREVAMASRSRHLCPPPTVLHPLRANVS